MLFLLSPLALSSLWHLDTCIRVASLIHTTETDYVTAELTVDLFGHVLIMILSRCPELVSGTVVQKPKWLSYLLRRSETAATCRYQQKE